MTYDGFMKDRATCALIYRIAQTTDPTGDRKRWPDCLAFKAPIMDLKILLRHMGIVDGDLRETIIATGRDVTGSDDTRAFAAILQAAFDESVRRQSA